MILQDCHATYRDIDTPIAISGSVTFNIALIFDCQINLFALDAIQFFYWFKKASVD